jgi:ketosteroid isomerase-like protein
MDGVALARAYYRAIDEDDYEALRDALAPGFVHRRPDRVIEGREAFVAFMRTGRPETNTEHAVDAVYEAVSADRVACEGRLIGEDGTAWFGFLDSFEVGEGGIREIRTYTDVGGE